MKVPKENIDKVLAIYNPNYRFLEEAEIKPLYATGKFKIKETGYVETLKYMTDIEAQLCLNQLSYVFFGQQIIDRRWQEFRVLSFDEYLDLRKENVFIIESKKKFVRETATGSAFSGEIKLLDMRKIKGLYLATLNFGLNDRACHGLLKFALRM